MSECQLVHKINIKHAREVIESWRRDYNEVRPHSSLKGRSPKAYAKVVAALLLASDTKNEEGNSGYNLQTPLRFIGSALNT